LPINLLLSSGIRVLVMTHRRVHAIRARFVVYSPRCLQRTVVAASDQIYGFIESVLTSFDVTNPSIHEHDITGFCSTLKIPSLSISSISFNAHFPPGTNIMLPLFMAQNSHPCIHQPPGSVLMSLRKPHRVHLPCVYLSWSSTVIC
jgi:hypothetical protein